MPISFVEAPALLHTKEGRALLAHAVYMPTEEKLRDKAEKYTSNEGFRIFFALADHFPIGLCILAARETEQEIEILSVHPAYRRQGVARRMLESLRALFSHGQLIAETDDDAVDFYRRCGFEITSMGEKYPGVIRYACTLGEENKT